MGYVEVSKSPSLSNDSHSTNGVSKYPVREVQKRTLAINPRVFVDDNNFVKVGKNAHFCLEACVPANPPKFISKIVIGVLTIAEASNSSIY